MGSQRNICQDNSQTDSLAIQYPVQAGRSGLVSRADYIAAHKEAGLSPVLKRETQTWSCIYRSRRLLKLPVRRCHRNHRRSDGATERGLKAQEGGGCPHLNAARKACKRRPLHRSPCEYQNSWFNIRRSERDSASLARQPTLLLQRCAAQHVSCTRYYLRHKASGRWRCLACLGLLVRFTSVAVACRYHRRNATRITRL